MLKKINKKLVIISMLAFALMLPNVSFAFDFSRLPESKTPIRDKVIEYAQDQGYAKFVAMADQMQKIKNANYLYQSMLDNAQKLKEQLAALRESWTQLRNQSQASQ